MHARERRHPKPRKAKGRATGVPTSGQNPSPSSLLDFCPDPTPSNQSPYDYTIFLDLCRGLGTVIGSPAPSRNCCNCSVSLARRPAPIILEALKSKIEPLGTGGSGEAEAGPAWRHKGYRGKRLCRGTPSRDLDRIPAPPLHTCLHRIQFCQFAKCTSTSCTVNFVPKAIWRRSATVSRIDLISTNTIINLTLYNIDSFKARIIRWIHEEIPFETEKLPDLTEIQLKDGPSTTNIPYNMIISQNSGTPARNHGMPAYRPP
jgi:hypothetical protein